MIFAQHIILNELFLAVWLIGKGVAEQDSAPPAIA